MPVKHFALAKTRLAPVLDQGEREALAAAMLADVLDALAGASGLDGVLVVTSDPCAAVCARDHAASVVEDQRGGLNEALAHGLAVLGEYGAATALVVPSDVPMITAREVDDLLDLSARRAVTIVPASSDSGTNALVLSAPFAIAPAFGADSFRRHVAAARSAGIEPLVSEHGGFGLDLDRPADVEALLAHPRACSTRTGRILARRLSTRPVGRPSHQAQQGA